MDFSLKTPNTIAIMFESALKVQSPGVFLLGLQWWWASFLFFSFPKEVKIIEGHFLNLMYFIKPNLKFGEARRKLIEYQKETILALYKGLTTFKVCVYNYSLQNKYRFYCWQFGVCSDRICKLWHECKSNILVH